MPKDVERNGNVVYGQAGEDDDEEMELVEMSPNKVKEAQPPTEPKGQNDEGDATGSVVVFAVLLYAACSSSLLVINKVAMHLVPDAPFILFCQFLSSAVACKLLVLVKPDIDIEGLKW